MPDAVVYAYPWDFEGDEAAADRAAGLGVNAVAVAASYHTTRAARPLHPERPLVEVTHPACYVPVRPAAWRGRRLVPRTPAWTASEDSFGVARDRLQRAGLATHAWVVLTHNSALGREHPDLVVRNAFGDRYEYALCPSAPDVVEYCATLVDEVVAAGPGEGLVLEACGPMGFEHNGVHEKTALSGWSAGQRDLLSLCFCGSCIARYRAAGVEIEELRDRVRQGVRSGSGPVEELLGQDLADRVAEVRTIVSGELRTLLAGRIKAVQPALRVTVHGSADRWATGSFSTVAPGPGADVDAVVASCFDLEPGVEAVAELRALPGAGAHAADRTERAQGVPVLGGVVRPGPGWDDDVELRDRLTRLRAAGMAELHLYHLGLVGRTGLRTLEGIASAFLDRPQKRQDPLAGKTHSPGESSGAAAVDP